ncbi:catalase family peroxidase [Pseudorhodoferax sp. Leaf267]|uniref:catalase family peroxidase n=1 Tax=Pseudorhodoferax sp. Leaf267 TaxID=1736316 RepID=UPI0006FBE614|nr:catalase family peroxidase [Pseudorhodoferax sp. Leaf267]KQP14110.1 catalase [Pseudorhodoferax sp. Leaf267]
MRTPIALPALMATTLLAALGAAPASAQVDPTRLVDAFERNGGKFEGYRRSGAKGVCAVAEFVGSAQGRTLSAASAFSGTPVPVIARFSVGGGNPKAPDNARSQRNMALQFDLPGGETWQMGNISAPVFGASTPEQFIGRLDSLTPDPQTKKPDPDRIKAFADANPDVLLQGKYFASQPVPASYARTNYWGVHAFAFIDAAGKKQFGKWVFEPVGGTQVLTDDEAKAKGADFLIDDLRQRVAAGEVAFDFMLQLAEPGDRLDSAVVPLPAERPKVNLGRLTVKSVAADATGPCVAITYNPIVLPKGVEASADPMLPARAAPYAISLGRRLVEGAKQ